MLMIGNIRIIEKLALFDFANFGYIGQHGGRGNCLFGRANSMAGAVLCLCVRGTCGEGGVPFLGFSLIWQLWWPGRQSDCQTKKGCERIRPPYWLTRSQVKSNVVVWGKTEIGAALSVLHIQT